jgi:serine/threonine-protein kinase
VVLTEDQTLLRTPSHLIAISHDGTKLVYIASGQLFLREMSQMDARPIASASASDPARPFFSPDDQWIGFYSFRDSALKKVPVAGGVAITICKTTGATTGRWDGDQIVFYEFSKGIMRVSEEGGEPQIVATTKKDEAVYYPQMLDHGRAVLFTSRHLGLGESWDQAQIVVQSLPSGERKVIVHGGSDGRYVASGHILYAVGGSVFAVPFDVKRLEAKGSAVAVINGVMRATGEQSGIAQLSVSDNGTLVYMPGEAIAVIPRRVLAFTDRSGKLETLPLPPAAYETPRISPDGKQIAVTTFDGNSRFVSVYELSTGTTLRRLTFGGGMNLDAIWSGDGKYVYFESNRDGFDGIFRQLADGKGPTERLMIAERPGNQIPQSMDPSGKVLIYSSFIGGLGNIFVLPLDGDRKPKPFAAMPGTVHGHAALSPDSQWLAYMSNELNTLPEVFVQSYPAGSKYQITTEGGDSPMWSPDGKQLFYHSGTKLFAVDVRTQPSFTAGKPTVLPIVGVVQPSTNSRNFDIAPDGKRFLVVMPASPTEAGPRSTIQINVVLNWFSELQQRVPVK